MIKETMHPTGAVSGEWLDLETLRPPFLDRRWEELRTLREELKDGRWDNFRRFGHNWKGFAEPYGFPKLASLGRELEEVAEAKDATRATVILDEINAYLEECSRAPEV